VDPMTEQTNEDMSQAAIDAMIANAAAAAAADTAPVADAAPVDEIDPAGEQLQPAEIDPAGQQLQPSAPAAEHLDADLARLHAVPVELAVEIGRTRMTIGDTLGLGPGSIITLNRMAGEPVDLLVNGRPIARGEVVVIDEEFGLRVTEVVGSAVPGGTAG
jgi:flagellar motor switch protein FliN/FliY